MISLIATVVADVLLAFLILLFFRLVMEYVFIFARSYRPTGVVLVVVEVAYTITDPPLKLLHRVIPPLRIGNVALDLAFVVLIIIISILMGVLHGL